MTARLHWLMILPALAASGSAAAQPADVPSVLQLVPTSDPIGVTLTADRTDGRYAIGEAVAISVTPVEDAFVYLFNIDAAGTVTQLYPNARAPAALVRGGERRQFPGDDAAWQIVADKAGSETVRVIATTTPVDFAGRAETTRAGPFTVFRQSGAAGVGVLRAAAEAGDGRWGTAALAITIGASGGSSGNLAAPPPLTVAELAPRTGPLDHLPTALPPLPVIVPSLF